MNLSKMSHFLNTTHTKSSTTKNEQKLDATHFLNVPVVKGERVHSNVPGTCWQNSQTIVNECVHSIGNATPIDSTVENHTSWHQSCSFVRKHQMSSESTMDFHQLQFLEALWGGRGLWATIEGADKQMFHTRGQQEWAHWPFLGWLPDAMTQEHSNFVAGQSQIPWLLETEPRMQWMSIFVLESERMNCHCTENCNRSNVKGRKNFCLKQGQQNNLTKKLLHRFG